MQLVHPLFGATSRKDARVYREIYACGGRLEILLVRVGLLAKRFLLWGKYQGIPYELVVLDRRGAYSRCGGANRLSVCPTLLCRYHRRLCFEDVAFRTRQDHWILPWSFFKTFPIILLKLLPPADFIGGGKFWKFVGQVWNAYRANRTVGMNNLFNINIGFLSLSLSPSLLYSRNKWSIWKSTVTKVTLFTIHLSIATLLNINSNQ